MRRVSPKLMVIMAAVLTLLLLAYVFAGDSSSGERPPSDRLTDRQAGVTAPRQAEQSAESWASLPGSEETASPQQPPPPPPEPEIEPGPTTQQAPIVRPDPPAPPTHSEAESRAQDRIRAEARARRLAESRAEAKRQEERAKEAAAAAARKRPAQAARRTSEAPAATATARPSYNCRYARTRSETAVCSDVGLASLDRQMAAQFNTAMRQGTPAQRHVLERSRLRFLYRRDRCQSAGCIEAAYRARMSEIDDIAARHWREP